MSFYHRLLLVDIKVTDELHDLEQYFEEEVKRGTKVEELYRQGVSQSQAGAVGGPGISGKNEKKTKNMFLETNMFKTK